MMVYIDLDGVLANWIDGFKNLTGVDASKINDLYPEKAKRHEFKKSVVEKQKLYESLPVMQDAKKLVNFILSNFDSCRVLSACGEYSPKEVVKQKKIWLKKNFPALSASNPIFTVHAEQKAKYASPDSILIDDMAKAVIPFKNAGGKVILHRNMADTIKKLKQIKAGEQLNEKLKLSNIMQEGRYDPGIFKAVFIVGGPGSGKSTFAKSLFGIPDNIITSVYGFKWVSSDQEFEYLLKKLNMSLDLRTPPENLNQIKNIARKLTKNRLQNYVNGKLGLIIDKTGQNLSDIEHTSETLKKEGYDIMVIFVNTSLETSLERNNIRDRKLPADLVTQMWKETQNNKKRLSDIGNYFLEVNSDKLKPGEVPEQINKIATWFSKKPITNPIANAWLKN